MSHIVDFSSPKHNDAAVRLEAFITWAQSTLFKGVTNHRVHAGIRWDMDSWHNSGIQSCAFTAHGSPRNSSTSRKLMQAPFMDFVKALVVYHCIFRAKKSAKDLLSGARILEVALLEMTGATNPTKISTAICNRACEHLRIEYPVRDSAYRRGKFLEQIIDLMRDKGLFEKSFRWTSPLQYKKSGTLKEQKKINQKRLPCPESIRALGELFNNNLSTPLDIVTLSACVLLLSQPSRIGELADVERDCVIYKHDAQGGGRMFLRWYGEKGFGATTKPVVKGMESAVERMFQLLTPITDEARTYAAWLEDYPDQFPPHEGLPSKDADEPLSYHEVCAALKTKVYLNHNARSIFKEKWLDSLAERTALNPDTLIVLEEIRQGWDNSPGQRVYVNGRLSFYQFNDKAVITLRKLNILVREKYLPKNFPYTTPAEDGKKRIKYRDALFTVRTGSLPDETREPFAMQRDFGVEIAVVHTRMTAQLGGALRAQSIFQRHGYGDIKVNTHAFRHELNTEMHRAGLSQLLIDAFSGRTSQGSVYNHVSIEEHRRMVAAVHPKTKHSDPSILLSKLNTNEPLNLSDVFDLGEGDSDRIIHKTHLGLCTHSFENEPCPKMGACLTCGRLGCVKGDDVKLSNLKEERVYLKLRFDKANAAEARRTFGASDWRKKTEFDLQKCDAMINALESPELQNGDIVWNVDNGWNLTKNAAVMAGLVDGKIIEAPKQVKAPSLEELTAMLNLIEV